MTTMTTIPEMYEALKIGGIHLQGHPCKLQRGTKHTNLWEVGGGEVVLRLLYFMVMLMRNCPYLGLFSRAGIQKDSLFYIDSPADLAKI